MSWLNVFCWGQRPGWLGGTGSYQSMLGNHQGIAAFRKTEAEPLSQRKPKGWSLGRPGSSTPGGVPMALTPWTPPLLATSKAHLDGEGKDGLGTASSGGSSLNELHRVGRKHSKVAIWPRAMLPAIIDHLNAHDGVLGVEGDLSVLGYLVAYRVWAQSLFPFSPMVHMLRASILVLQHWPLHRKSPALGAPHTWPPLLSAPDTAEC